MFQRRPITDFKSFQAQVATAHKSLWCVGVCYSKWQIQFSSCFFNNAKYQHVRSKIAAGFYSVTLSKIAAQCAGFIGKSVQQMRGLVLIQKNARTGVGSSLQLFATLKKKLVL